MGSVENIDFDKSPKRGSHYLCKVKVCFNYDTSKILSGTVVRDDAEAPHRTIIQLEDGRYLLSTECMYTLD